MKRAMPLVSIITVNYNGKEFLKDCFDSLYSLNYPVNKLEVIMVDNSSSDGSLDYTKKHFPAVKIVINNENSYTKANNLGIKAAKGEYIALINNDVRVDQSWLTELIRTITADAQIGAAGSKILFMDGTLQSVGHQEYPNFYWGDIGFREEDEGQYNTHQEIVSICGCSVLYRRECLEDVGLLDEDFNMFVEDVDMGIRCRKKGWKILTCSESVIYHKFHGTIVTEDNARHRQEVNRLLLIAKHWPEKLADALAGKGHFIIKDTIGSARDISEVIAKVFNKILKEHGQEILDKLSPEVFKAVRKIYNFEKSHLIQKIKNNHTIIFQKDQEISAKNEELFIKGRQMEVLRQQKDQELFIKGRQMEALRQQKELELNNNTLLLQQARKELSDIYASTGYRRILKPLWDFLWEIKGIYGKLRIFLTKKINTIVDLKEKIKSNVPRMKLYHFKNLLSIVLPNIYKEQNVWRIAYCSHIKNGTFAPHPDTATLMITKRCNLTCQMCDLKNENEEMKTEDTFRIIDNLNKIGIKGIVLTGGEPFLHKGLFDIIAYAKEKGIRISITTNGSLLHDYTQQIINSKINGIHVSLDGFAASHDSLRRKKGLYEAVKNNILALKDKQQNVSINYVVTKNNFNELEAFYDWAQARRIPLDFWPVNHRKELFINPDNEYDTFLKFVKKLRNKNQISGHKYAYYLGVRKYLNSKNMLRVRCLGLAQSLGIYVNGDIRICCVWAQAHPSIGNAIKDDLEALWHSNEYRGLRRNIYEQGCYNGCYNSSLSDFSRITGNDFMFFDKETNG